MSDAEKLFLATEALKFYSNPLRYCKVTGKKVKIMGDKGKIAARTLRKIDSQVESESE